MKFIANLIRFLLLLSLCACATQPPRYHGEAGTMVERIRREGAAELFPAESKSTVEAFERGEALLLQGEHEDAEDYFLLTLQKGAVLEKEIREERARRAEAARLVEEGRQAELRRRAEQEAQRLAQAKAEAEAKAEADALARKDAAEAERRKSKPTKEHLLVFSYTVRRGESLPLIASQPQVYGDRNLWPLLYRANRDQISDPHHIWPGQVLRIPRNLGREDIAEARRYALERPLH